jgi:hypothetical protein
MGVLAASGRAAAPARPSWLAQGESSWERLRAPGVYGDESEAGQAGHQGFRQPGPLTRPEHRMAATCGRCWMKADARKVKGIADG